MKGPFLFESGYFKGMNSASRPIVERQVVTCFLESENEILLLRRSEQGGSYQGRWAGVSGYIETTPDEQALIQIEEETNLEAEALELVGKGEPLPVEDEQIGVRWVVHSYFFHIKDRGKIRIDWEHKETRWVRAEEIGDYETVPMLKETLTRALEG